MTPADFQNFTEQLRASLESRSEVLGLVTIGSTADATFRDEWSDHDFWVITKAGAQDALVDDLSWLPQAHDIAIKVCHARHRRTVLYSNGQKVEFAVFDPNNVRDGKIERYRVLIDRGNIAQLIASIHQETIKEAQPKPDSLENFCLLIWSACERYGRGEFLSARQYLDGLAVNQLLSLLAASDNDAVPPGQDVLDPRRRLELRAPLLAAEVLKVIDKPVPQGALHLLEIAEREGKSKAPNLAWEKVSMVQQWICELGKKVAAD
ncbi:MAG: hypothetical protein AABM67_19975 [Acidobacteriota bacterium]